MSAITRPTPPPVVYPDSDGRPIADNALQYRWIVTLKGSLDVLFRDRPDVLVSADHLIYTVEGNPKRRTAPDVYVAFGRPKGDRGSYKVWEEGGIFPQVVFEVRSPGNRAGEMAKKLAFYAVYGAEEYYDYDPDRHRLRAYRRADGQLDAVEVGTELTSPLLGIRFDMSGPELVVYYPDGQPFLTYDEIFDHKARAERQARIEAEQARAAEEQARAAEEQARAAEEQRQSAEQERDAEREKSARLAARLRELGIDPDAV